MKYLLWAFLLCVITACGRDKGKTQVPHFGAERYDSTALHVALVPNKDCLPVYFAARRGIYDKLGLNLQIATYASQMDCDTALLGRIADGGMADRERLAAYGKRAGGLAIQWNGTASWQLYVCGSLRVKDVKSLKGRTVAIARESAENAWLSQILQQAGLSAADVYRPQINDLKLRAEMLSGNQVDAAVLTWPYTSLASAEGHRRIHAQSKPDANACFVMKAERLAKPGVKRQWELFEKGRRMALDSIRQKGPQAYSLILQKDYGLPKEVADTLRY